MSIIRQICFIFCTIIVFCSLNPYQHQTKHFIIMIDPAGDARQTGRVIGDNFERAITYQIAKELQTLLQESLSCTVIITRTPGEIVYPLQNANFANRLLADFYISLHCYHNPNEKYTIALFHLQHNDIFISSLPELSMVSCNKAHWNSQKSTKKYISLLYTYLKEKHTHQFFVPEIAAIPLTFLIGIQAPAISIEMNILSYEDIPLYSESLAKGIITTLTS